MKIWIHLEMKNENLDNIILEGDLNCPLDPLLDKKCGAGTKRKTVISCVDDFKKYFRFSGYLEIQNPNAKSFTWRQKSPSLFCRLDQYNPGCANRS